MLSKDLKNRGIKFLPFLALILCIFLFQAQPSLASCNCQCQGGAMTGPAVKDTPEACTDSCTSGISTCSPIPPATPAGTGSVSLPNPLGTTDIPTLIGKIINYFLGIIGSVALVMFIFGGFTWLTSGGSPDRIKKGTSTIIWASAAIAMIFVSYAVLKLVIAALQ